MRHELHQARVDEDAGRDGVENAAGDESALALRGVRLTDAEADSNGNGGREAVADGESVRSPALGYGPGDGGQTGAETEAFKGLVEDEDDVEGDELVARDGKRQADEDGVEDDAELEDEDGRQLRRVRFRDKAVLLPRVGELLVGNVLPLMAVVVVARHVGMAVLALQVVRFARVGHCDFVLRVDAGDAGTAAAFTVLFFVVVGVLAKVSVAHYHEFDEEDDENGH